MDKSYSQIKYDNLGNIVDFGGWESEEAKLRNNLTWTPEQILQWLEEANGFSAEIHGAGTCFTRKLSEN